MGAWLQLGSSPGLERKGGNGAHLRTAMRGPRLPSVWPCPPPERRGLSSRSRPDRDGHVRSSHVARVSKRFKCTLAVERVVSRSIYQNTRNVLNVCSTWNGTRRYHLSLFNNHTANLALWQVTIVCISVLSIVHDIHLAASLALPLALGAAGLGARRVP